MGLGDESSGADIGVSGIGLIAVGLVGFVWDMGRSRELVDGGGH